MNPSVESSLGAGSAVTAIAANGMLFLPTAGFTRSYMLSPLSRLRAGFCGRAVVKPSGVYRPVGNGYYRNPFSGNIYNPYTGIYTR